MKTVIIILILSLALFAETKKVCFYTTDNNINNFKSLKVNFDRYLQRFGNYEFQAFSDKNAFERCVSVKNNIIFLSSWHYSQIAKRYNLQANLIAQKKNKTTDTRVLIGKKGAEFEGILTSSYNQDQTEDLLSALKINQNFSIVQVPKELDALMSVGFGMSSFALVSKDSFLMLQNRHDFLVKDLDIYKESSPSCRMLVASSTQDKQKERLVEMFTTMPAHNNGKKILDLLGIDKIVVLNKNDLKNIEDSK